MPKNKLSLSVQYPDPRLRESLTRALLRRWVQAALEGPAELTIRLVDKDEGRALNRDFRGKDYATNVLTFAYNDPLEAEPAQTTAAEHRIEADGLTQADLILCTDVLQSEAAAQGKSIVAHAAHLVVHGLLHAQGHDHDNDDDAEAMERLEARILATLGFSDPYFASYSDR